MKMRLLLGLLVMIGFTSMAQAYNPPKCQGIEYYPFVFQECLNGIFKQYKGTQCYNLAGSKIFYQSCVNTNLTRLGLHACTQIQNNPYGFENCVNTQIRQYAKTTNAVSSTVRELERGQRGEFERSPREEERPVVNDQARNGFEPASMERYILPYENLIEESGAASR